MDDNFKYDENLQTFLKDQDIEDAYQVLKPVFDKIHEDFITKSLENDEAKKIDFSKYFKLKSKFLELKEKSESNKIKKEIEKEEKHLRERFSKVYKST
jgi:predicted P-loop ATPase